MRGMSERPFIQPPSACRPRQRGYLDEGRGASSGTHLIIFSHDEIVRLSPSHSPYGESRPGATESQGEEATGFGQRRPRPIVAPELCPTIFLRRHIKPYYGSERDLKSAMPIW
jgi:hypothetical protein